MSEEEKKAIDILQHYLEMEEFDSAGDFLVSIDIVLKLINKQQKEIKKLEEQKRGLLVETYKNNDEKDKEIEELKKDRYLYNGETGEITKIKSNSISKTKIREKIKELEENNRRIERQSKGGTQNLMQNYIENTAQIKILQELLEE